jgi:hypothetical protein
MANHADRGRASRYRQRAQQLAASAEHIRDESDRRYALSLSATFEHAADLIAPKQADPFDEAQPQKTTPKGVYARRA